MVAYLLENYSVSISRACRVARLPKSMYYYKNVRDDSETINKLVELAEKHPTEGQDLYYSRIRQQGFHWNYKRVRRVYLLLGMNKRRRYAGVYRQESKSHWSCLSRLEIRGQ